MKKKNIIFTFLGLLFIFTLSACEKNVPKEIVGDWMCEETPLESDAYTGYLTLEIYENGTFSLYDYSGNPGISGTLEAKGDTLELLSSSEEFDPPTTWEDMETIDEVTYEIKDNKLYLAYDNSGNTSTLVFYPE